MDTGEGIFKMITADSEQAAREALQLLKAEHPRHGGTFYIGQNIEFNGSRFRVLAISKHTVTLKLLPKVTVKA